MLALKDTYHTIKLLESSKPYCGILPYFESASYIQKRMSMGLIANPAILQCYINDILCSIPDISKYLAIMDDLLLHRTKYGLLKYFEVLLKTLLKNVLKISPKNCQLFRPKWQYLGNTIFIKDKKVCIKTSLETYKNLNHQMTAMDCHL